MTALEAFDEGSHGKRDDHPPVKKDEEEMKEENKNMPKDRIRRDIEGDGQKLPKNKDGEIDWKKADEMAADIRQAKPETRLAKENIEEEAKPDFPDVDGDGDRKEPISKAQKDKKAKEGGGKKKKDLSKVPPQLRKHVAGKGSEDDDEKEEIEEASTMGGGNVQGHSGGKKKKPTETEKHRREREANDPGTKYRRESMMREVKEILNNNKKIREIIKNL